MLTSDEKNQLISVMEILGEPRIQLKTVEHDTHTQCMGRYGSHGAYDLRLLQDDVEAQEKNKQMAVDAFQILMEKMAK